MTAFIIRRAIQSVFLLVGVTVVSFTLQRLAPGGPEQFTEDPRLPPNYREQQRKDLGLDQPLPVQYAKWFVNIVQGDFGRSFTDKRPVIDKIQERLGPTLLLSGSGLLIGLLGIPLGVYAALRRGGWFDNVLRFVTVLGNSTPNWFLGLIILMISVRTVDWFPLGGMYSVNDRSLLDRLHHLLLPAVVIGTDGWLTYSRFMRSEMLDVIGQDYIRTARAKGLTSNTVLYRHALRNALIVCVTLLGSVLALLLSSSVLVENIFSWPGLGRLGFESTLQRDYPVLMALVVIGSALVIVGNLIADVLYGIVDPRIRY